MAQQPPLGQGLLIIEASRSHSVGLLWTSDQPEAETSTWQHTTLTIDNYPCPRRDSNRQFQQASDPQGGAATGIPAIINEEITPSRRAIFEKLTVSQLVKKFPAFYRTLLFTTMVTRPCHMSLICARWINYRPSQCMCFKIHVNFIPASIPRLPKRPLPFRLPCRNSVCPSVLLPSFHHTTLLGINSWYNIRKQALCKEHAFKTQSKCSNQTSDHKSISICRRQ